MHCCGDGILDWVYGEGCDFGNLNGVPLLGSSGPSSARNAAVAMHRCFTARRRTTDTMVSSALARATHGGKPTPDSSGVTFALLGHPISGTHQRERNSDMTTTGTVRLHRVIRATPERTYRAFLDPDAMAKWLPPHGFTGNVHHLDAKVGGTFKMSFTNFATGRSHSFGGEYLELVPNERIGYTDKFDDPNMPGEMRTTVSLKPVSCGTELSIVQEGIPAMIPTEMCYLGWQESLTLLAQLVEAEIPD
jgi:uncharacterized protein YndB with AHSA1/START domain